jgi:hypothetical protein
MRNDSTFFAKKKSKFATRHQFLRDLVLLVVLLGVALGTLSLVLDVQSHDDLARDRTSQAVQKARQRFASQIEPIVSMLKVIGKWGEEGQLDLDKPSTLNMQFIPLLEENSGVASLAIANERGEYLLLPERKGWLTRTVSNTRKSKEFLWQRWISANKSIQAWNEKADNNSDKRKWYQRFTSDRNSSKLVWSVTYNHSNDAEPVIIATKRFTEPNQAESVSVARTDIRLSKITKGIETECFASFGIGKSPGFISHLLLWRSWIQALMMRAKLL